MSALKADEVARWLRDNPVFFEEHAALLTEIQVPNPHGGQAIPLSDRQVVSLRDKAKALEAKLAELIQFGEENDAISEKVHRLAVGLAGTRDFAALVHSLYFHLREDFAVPHVSLRIWGKSLPAQAAEAAAVDEAQRLQAEALGGPQCGPASGNAFLQWFGEAADHVRSVALVPLGQSAVFGLLALGTEDPKRFYPEMGTLYLRRIGELCAAGVTARL